jgi:hypothetical protein
MVTLHLIDQKTLAFQYRCEGSMAGCRDMVEQNTKSLLDDSTSYGTVRSVIVMCMPFFV